MIARWIKAAALAVLVVIGAAVALDLARTLRLFEPVEHPPPEVPEP